MARRYSYYTGTYQTNSVGNSIGIWQLIKDAAPALVTVPLAIGFLFWMANAIMTVADIKACSRVSTEQYKALYCDEVPGMKEAKGQI